MPRGAVSSAAQPPCTSRHQRGIARAPRRSAFRQGVANPLRCGPGGATSRECGWRERPPHRSNGVTNITVLPLRRHRLRKSSCNLCRVNSSSAAKGSSISSNLVRRSAPGRWRRACACPPKAYAAWSGELAEPHLRQRCGDRAARRRAAYPAQAQGEKKFPATSAQGSNVASWNTKPISPGPGGMPPASRCGRRSVVPARPAAAAGSICRNPRGPAAPRIPPRRSRRKCHPARAARSERFCDRLEGEHYFRRAEPVIDELQRIAGLVVQGGIIHAGG